MQMQNTNNQLQIAGGCHVKNQLVILTVVDKNLFWHFWQEYKGLLYSRCLIWVNGNNMMAEDLLSEVLLKAWDKIQAGKGPTRNMKGWLLRMIDCFCIDQHRKFVRQSQILQGQLINDQDTIGGSTVDPIDVTMAQELSDTVDEAINSLPERLRETFILHFRHDFSYQEIAQQQNISYVNVRQRISNAKNILRGKLKNY
jgi:RNA polymerase sigma-70 factor (ECF subfamily)